MSDTRLTERPLLIEAGSEDTRPSSLDPRSTLLLLLVVNIVVMGRTPMTVVAVAGLLVCTLLVTVRPRIGGIFGAAIAASFVVYFGLPRVWQGMIPAAMVGAIYWLVRFVISIGMAGYLMLTIRPAALVAALRRLRIPSAVVIPVVVMLRFIPVVIAEARAVTDAMRLRGLEPGGSGLLRRPLATLEMVIVPLLASISRIADDLTASGLIRGLGSPVRPTSRVRLGFGLADAIAIALAIGLALFAWWVGR